MLQNNVWRSAVFRHSCLNIVNTVEATYTIQFYHLINFMFSFVFQILTPFMLRRLKEDVDLNIPPKKEVLVYAPLSTRQSEFYEATVNRTIFQKLEEKNVGVDFNIKNICLFCMESIINRDKLSVHCNSLLK